MKKRIIGTALVLLMGIAYASANGTPAKKCKPNAERNILSSQLPAGLLTDIKTGYKDYWITDCYEKGQKKEASYFITMENADQTVRLSSGDSKSWVVTDISMK